MKLSVDLIESLSGVYLSPKYDQPQPTPEFHRDCWERYCSDHPACATAAPRNHAKSTALTHDYGLASVLFRDQDYVIIVGASEDMAIEHLNDLTTELRDNEDIIRDFKIKEFITDAKTDCIVECLDGHQFRLIARGAEQKIRGRKWRGKRPGLIIFDDIEDDEQVESRDRRTKFRRWFFRACKQSLRDGGKIRGHGTILHEDSLLNHLMKNPGWDSVIYKAHNSFDDFDNPLWPEKFPIERLKAIRQEFIDEGDSAGYSQEYLNDPFDNDEAYLRKQDFIEMNEDDRECSKILACAIDFAVSKNDRANRSSFTIGGRDTANRLHFIDQRVGRMDALEIIEEIFTINSRWSPEVFFVEDGVIWKTLLPMINSEMLRRNIFINFVAQLPVKDKKTRGRSFQKRMRAGACRFDKQCEWYPNFENELLRFTGNSEAVLDDQFDSAALLAKGLETYNPPEIEDFYTDEEEEFIYLSKSLKNIERNSITGY